MEFISNNKQGINNISFIRIIDEYRSTDNSLRFFHIQAYWDDDSFIDLYLNAKDLEELLHLNPNIKLMGKSGGELGLDAAVQESGIKAFSGIKTHKLNLEFDKEVDLSKIFYNKTTYNKRIPNGLSISSPSNTLVNLYHLSSIVEDGFSCFATLSNHRLRSFNLERACLELKDAYIVRIVMGAVDKPDLSLAVEFAIPILVENKRKSEIIEQGLYSYFISDSGKLRIAYAISVIGIDVSYIGIEDIEDLDDFKEMARHMYKIVKGLDIDIRKEKIGRGKDGGIRYYLLDLRDIMMNSDNYNIGTWRLGDLADYKDNKRGQAGYRFLNIFNCKKIR